MESVGGKMLHTLPILFDGDVQTRVRCLFTDTVDQSVETAPVRHSALE